MFTYKFSRCTDVRQLIIVDDTVQETYINDFDFLLPPMAFAIVWNGEVVARGEVTDIGSPMIVSYPVLHVLEPVANPEYSTRRLLSSYNPAYASVEDFTILLRSEKKSAVSLEKDVTELIFEDSVASEIKKHFRQTGRLVK